MAEEKNKFSNWSGCASEVSFHDGEKSGDSWSNSGSIGQSDADPSSENKGDSILNTWQWCKRNYQSANYSFLPLYNFSVKMVTNDPVFLIKINEFTTQTSFKNCKDNSQMELELFIFLKIHQGITEGIILG